MKFRFDTKEKEESFLKTRVESLELAPLLQINLASQSIITVRGLVHRTDKELENIVGSDDKVVAIIDALDKLALEIDLSTNNPESSKEINEGSDSFTKPKIEVDDDIIENFSMIILFQ